MKGFVASVVLSLAVLYVSSALAAPASDACVKAAEDLFELKDVMAQLRQELAANPSPRGCPAQGKKGIAMTIGTQQHVDNAYVSIAALRNEHNSTLPVTVFHWGDEVTADVKELFETKFGAQFVDLQPLNTALPHKCHDKSSKPGGFQIKVLAAYHSLNQFEHLLWLDADNFALAPVEPLFEQEDYQQTGSTFWPDFFVGWVQPDIYEVLTEGKYQPSEQSDTESGQFLLNTCQHQDVLEYLQALNENSEIVYDHMFGDKDTFRLAFALAGKIDKFNQVQTSPGGGFTTVGASSELQRVHAEAAMLNNDLLDVGEFASRCQFPNPALLVGMLQISAEGEPQFYHRTNSEFSLKNMDQVRTEFVLAPRSPQEAEDLLWQVPYPSQGWAFCTEEAAPLGTPASINTLENGATSDLADLREAITSGSLDNYPDMKSGKQPEIVRAMEITTSNLRRVGNSTNSTGGGGGGGGGSDPEPYATIVQVVTLTFPDSVTTTTFNDGSDGYQSMCNYAYGLSLTIWSSADGWTTGCSVSSEAADASRRASLAVTFTAEVSEAAEADATTAAEALDPDTFDSNMASVIASEGLSIEAPVTSDVADPAVTLSGATPTSAPTYSMSTSGASSAATVSALAMGAVLMALSRW